MSICPHCNKDMGFSPWEDHVCGVIGYVKITDEAYLCKICGHIQNQLGICEQCKNKHNKSHGHCACCGCCKPTCRCACCCL